jgi:hypothetical protein
MKLEIRQPDRADLVGVGALIREIILNSRDLTAAAQHFESSSYTSAGLEDFMADTSCVLLSGFINGSPVGFIHAQTQVDIAWLSWVGIRADYRRCNVCWYLWKRVFFELRQRGVRKLWGWIVATNQESIDMAKRIGFLELAQLENFRHGLDYVLVIRDL